MRASLGFHVVALCFISSSLIWVNADWEEWSTWSGCSQNRSCQSNDVIITSNRTRCCKVTKDDSSIYLQDCKGPNIEIRTCECGEKYNEEAAPIQNTDNRVIGDQVVSRLLRVQGVHEHANSTSNEVGSRRSSTANQLLVANSRKPRAADLLSFLAKQPAISGTGGPKQKENYISDYMQLHDLADTKNMSGINDGHSQYLKSFKDFLQKVPNEDIIKQELDQLNDVLLLRGPTVPVKENVSVVKPTSPLSVAVDTTTQVDLGTEVPVSLTSQDVSTALASQQPQEASNGEAGEQEGGKDNEEKEPPSEDFLKLVEDIGASPDEVDAQHIDKIANFMDTLKETTDEEELSENINFWNEKLKAGQHSEGSSTEVGASLKTTTMPTKLSGEDLLFSLINRIGPTQESEMRDLGPLLDEMNKLSSNEVSGEELDQINELLNVVKEEDILTTTEATAPTAGSISNLIADGAYLLQLLNKTEMIDQTQLKNEFKDDFVVLNRLLETSNGQPSKDIQDILDKISDLVNARTTIKMTEYSTTIPATITTHIGSTLADGAHLLNMIQEFPENKKKQNEENQLQVQHMEDLFSDIREQNKDVLSQEIIHMKQLLNPSNVSRDISAPMFVTTSGEATTAPSTMVAKEKVLDFVGEIAGLAMNEDMNNKQQMEDINDIFERVKESDGDVLPNEVHQLLGLLSHSTVATTTGMAHITGGVKESTIPLETTELSLQKVPGTSTAAPSTSTATTAPSKEKVLDFVQEIAGLTGNEQLINQKEMEGINDILQNVQESDRDVLKNEVHQLLGLLVASTLESTTLKASSIASYDTLASNTLPASTTAAYERATKGDGETLLETIEEFKATNEEYEKEDRLQVQGLEKIFDDVEESNQDMLYHEINHLNQLLNPTAIPVPTSPVEKVILHSTILTKENVTVLVEEFKTHMRTEEFATTPYAVVAKEDMLDLLDEISVLAGKDKTKSSQEVQDIQDVLEGVHELDEDVLADEIKHLKGLISSGGVSTTQKPHMPTIVSSTEEFATRPYAAVTKEDMLDLLDDISVLAGKDKTKSKQEVQDIQDVLEGVHELDEDVLADEIKHLKGLISSGGVSTTQKPHLPTIVSSTEEFSTTPYAVVTKEDMLDLLDEISVLAGKDKTQSRQDVHDIQDVLEGVHELDEDVLVDEIKHLKDLILGSGVSTTQKPRMPTIVSSTEEFATTPYAVVTKENMLDLLDEISVLAGKDETQSRQEVHDIQDVLEGVHELDEDVLVDEIKHLQGLILSGGVSTTQKPHMPTIVSATEEFATTPYDVVGKEDMLELLDEISVLAGKDKTKSRQDVHDIQDVLEGVHELDEDVLVDEIKHLQGLIMGGGVSTTQRPHMPTIVSTTEEFATTPHAAVTKEDMLDLLDEISVLAGKDKTESRQEVQDIQDVLEGVHELDEDVLVDEIKHLKGLIMGGGVSTTQNPHLPTIVSSTEEFATRPYAVVTKEDMLDLLDEISVLAGKDKTESRQKVHDIQDVLEGVHELDKNVLVDEIKHLQCLILSGGVISTTQTPHLPTPVSATSTASEVVTFKEISTATSHTYHQRTSPCKPLLQPTIVGKYVLDFLQKVENISQNRLKSDFEDDVNLVDQFVKANNLNVGEDLGAVISHIGAFLSRNISSKTPFIVGVKTVSPIVTSKGSPLVSAIPPLPSTVTVAINQEPTTVPTELVHEPLLDLIETLGKASTVGGHENRLEVQRLQDIWAEEGKLQENILGDELDHLNKVLNPEKYTTKMTPLHPLTVSPSPWQREVQISSSIPTEEGVKLTTVTIPRATSPLEEHITLHQTPFAGENLLELFDEVPEGSRTELQKNKEGMEVFGDVLKGVKESDEDFVSNEVDQLIAMLLPVEAVGTALGPLHATTPALWTAVGHPVVTEKEPGIFEKGETQLTTSAGHPQPTVMTVPLQQGAAKSTLSKAYDVSEVTEMPENKNNQVLLDILSGPLMLDSDLVQDAAGMQGIAELFTNLTQTDEEMYINEIAQLDHGLHHGVETTLAYQMSTEPTEQNVLTKLTTKGLVGKLHSLFPSTRTTVTSSTSRGYGKDFLDTLRQLGDQTNEGIDWEDINRLGELSEGHLDTEDREGLKDGLEFVSKIQKEYRASTTTFRPMYSATTKKMASVTAEPTNTSTPTTTEMKTATPVPSQVAIQTAEETFLDTMRELVAGVNLNLPWVQIKRVGALSGALDKNASKEVEDELRWTDNVADIVNEVGELENRTPGTTHVPSTATTAASTTLSPVIETSVAKRTTTEVSTPPLATTPYSPVDRWTEWSPWGDCSSTCGLGEQSRSRECRLFIEGLIIPSSSCEGSRAETMVCETRRCPETPRVDGQWSGWSVWTECSAMCGPGKQTRYRVCDSPQPAGNDGLPCEGSMTDEQDCVGQADVCEETGVKASTSSTPRSQVIKPARQPVNKTVPVIVLIVFIVVVALAFVACFTVKLRRVYGKKRYRGGKPIFENDTLVSSLQSHAP